MSYAANPYEIPVAQAEVPERVAFLRKVAGLTFVSLLITAVASLASAGTVLGLAMAGVTLPWLLTLVLMMGGIYGAQFVGGSMTRSESAGTRMTGFVLGSGLQGMALGFLILTATLLSADLYANPMVIPFQGITLVGLTVVGMVGYLLTGPKNLSLIAGGISALFLPMLGLMVLTVMFPMNGIMGILVSLVFVAVSAGGLLVNLNQVMHQYSTRMPVAAAFHISVGIVVLFWNVVVLLMRLQRR